MKVLFTIFLMSILRITGFTQIIDSVNMNNGFALDVFYSLENGGSSPISNSEWTVAFSTPSTSSQVLINDGNGVELYSTSENISNFSSFNDISGIASWTKLHNDFSDYEHSAFESGKGEHPDYGWGNYTGTPLHDLVGDKLFVLKTLNNTYYKVVIDVQSHGEWSYHYATLDNSFDTTVVYQASDLQDRNYVYFNMDNHTFLNREPANTTWDMVFTKYYSINSNSVEIGAIVNKEIEVLQIDNENTASSDFEGKTFSLKTNEIGYDWKNTSNDIIADRTYFIKNLDKKVYKLIFTRHDGSATGKTVFSKEMVGDVSSVYSFNNFKVISIYPNPAKGIANIVFDVHNKNQTEISIYNIVGKQIFNKKMVLHRGLNNIEINVQDYYRGVYLVRIQSGTNTQTLKLNVSK